MTIRLISLLPVMSDTQFCRRRQDSQNKETILASVPTSFHTLGCQWIVQKQELEERVLIYEVPKKRLQNSKEKVKKFSGKLDLTWQEYKVEDFRIKQHEFAAIPACWNPEELNQALIFPDGRNFTKPVLVLYNHHLYVLKLCGKKPVCFGATEIELLILFSY
jgi:hypothetical protein